MKATGSHRGFHRVAWFAAVLLIAWWTLLPFSLDLSFPALRRAFHDIQWVPFVERGRAPLWSDVFANLGLFAPFGFAAWRCLEHKSRRLVWVLAAAALTSLAVETVQLGLPARRTSATDLVIDALGAGMGALMAKGWEVHGRHSAHQWYRRLSGGGREHVLSLLFAVCLLLWAAVPGSAPEIGVWEQTQRLTSSFRRFPGWERWLGLSVHPFLLGVVFSTLAARSSRGAPLTRGVFGFGSAALLGLGLELVQLLAPQRRPGIFDALAFGAGGLVSLLTAFLPPALLRGGAVAVVLAGAVYPVQGDNPGGVTVLTVVLGGVFWFAAGSRRSGGGAALQG